MALSDSEYHEIFEEYIGTDGPASVYPNADHDVYGWEEWAALAPSGLDEDGFGAFLVAFYPEAGISGADWDMLRAEFFDQYDIDPNEFDWEGWREAIGYG